MELMKMSSARYTVKIEADNNGERLLGDDNFHVAASNLLGFLERQQETVERLSRHDEHAEPHEALIGARAADPIGKMADANEELSDLAEPAGPITLTIQEFSKHMNDHAEANIRLLRNSIQGLLIDASDAVHEENERDPEERLPGLVQRLTGRKLGLERVRDICDEALRKLPRRA